MAKPIEQWDEHDILGLPPGENDTFERKGSRLLDLSIPGINENDVLNELAKQVSAFANTGGGRIFYGVNDDGRVDNGGIATSVKGKTKQWLEDVIRTQTEFEILGYNVYEVLPLQNDSSITAGKALYIVDIPDSDRAPHQSRRDFKYYIRVASKSLPAPHRILEDIRNRQKHADVNLSGISLEVVQLPTFSYTRPSLTLRDSTPSFQGTITLRFHVSLKNTSQVIARNTCFKLWSSVPGRITKCDERTVSSRGDGFWELGAPIYPNMEIKFWFDCQWNALYGPVRSDWPWGGPWFFHEHEADQIEFSWSLYADNAIVKKGQVALTTLNFERIAAKTVAARPDANQVYAAFPNLRQ